MIKCVKLKHKHFLTTLEQLSPIPSKFKISQQIKHYINYVFAPSEY